MRFTPMPVLPISIPTISKEITAGMPILRSAKGRIAMMAVIARNSTKKDASFIVL
jgi:hypothetical protein